MITPGAGEAVYRQVARALEAEARHGGPGYLFPAATQLARQYGLGVDTVRDAYQLLTHLGVLSLRRGYGAVVRSQREREQIRLPAGTVVTARMPTLDEVDAWELDPGVPVLEAGGEVWPADRVELVVGTDGEPPPTP